jgi:PleD family two-component response regulator
MTQTILLGIHDLILSTKVNSVARSLGIPTITTFTPHDLLSKAHAEESALVILDLNEEQIHPIQCINEIKKDSHTQNITIVGFYSGSDSEVSKLAKESGCDFVLGNSQFFESIDTILTGKLSA